MGARTRKVSSSRGRAVLAKQHVGAGGLSKGASPFGKCPQKKTGRSGYNGEIQSILAVEILVFAK